MNGRKVAAMSWWCFTTTRWDVANRVFFGWPLPVREADGEPQEPFMCYYMSEPLEPDEDHFCFDKAGRCVGLRMILFYLKNNEHLELGAYRIGVAHRLNSTGEISDKLAVTLFTNSQLPQNSSSMEPSTRVW